MSSRPGPKTATGGFRMRSTNSAPAAIVEESADALARALVDDDLDPGGATRTNGDCPLKGEPERGTYFVEPDTSRLPTDFAFPGGGEADGLVDAMVAYWA